MSQYEINRNALIDYLDSQYWHYTVQADGDPIFVATMGMSLDCRLYNCQVHVTASGKEIQSYAVCPIRAKPEVYQNVVEYITRANHGLKVGAFEFDYDDGEVRYHSCISCEESAPSSRDIERTVDITFLMMDHYGDGLVKNLMGFGDPEADIREAEGDD